MAGFFDKIKQGAAEAGKKAQVTLEVNRLKMQISSLRKEIQRIYAVMGETIYRQIGQGNDRSLPEACIEWAREIDLKNAEIERFEEMIRELKEETICTCGHVNPRDNKFCSRCGQRLEAAGTDRMIEGSGDIIETRAICPSYGHQVEPDQTSCGHCGHSLQS